MHEPSFSHSLPRFAFTPPDAVDPLLIHMPAICTEQRRDPAITVTSEPGSKFDDRLCQHLLVATHLSRLALRGAVLADHTASPALRHAKLFYHMIDRNAFT